MSGDLIPLLWLCGAPGVGKSTVGWEIFGSLSQAGIRAGYLDIDQLGMSFPEPASEPERRRMVARNLGAMVATFQAAGARCVVVSGVVDAADGIRGYADQVPQAAVTACWLRGGHDELKERLLGRGLPADQVDVQLREGAALDHSAFADVSIDTSGVPVAEVTRLVRKQTGGWPALTGPAPSSGGEVEPTAPEIHPVDIPGPILWLCGATGVGKSTVGWRIFETVRRAGVTAAFLDLDQIGFLHPAPADDPDNHRVKARNLAAMWQNFRASGARCLIVNGPVAHHEAVAMYTRALPEAAPTLVRLHAGRDQLTQRIMLRQQGGSWAAPGDPLKGRPTAVLHQVAAKATAAAETLERAAIGDLCVDTDGRTVEEVAQEVLAKADGWPGLAE